MARPSGTCNGQSCYTAQDKAEIEAEIAVLNAEKTVLNAEIEVINQALVPLEHELGDAIRNACPC